MGRNKGISYAQIRVMVGSWFAKDPDLTLREISKRTGVSEQTLVSWKKQDRWEEERDLYQQTPIAIERALLKEMKTLATGGEPTIKVY